MQIHPRSFPAFVSLISVVALAHAGTFAEHDPRYRLQASDTLDLTPTEESWTPSSGGCNAGAILRTRPVVGAPLRFGGCSSPPRCCCWPLVHSGFAAFSEFSRFEMSRNFVVGKAGATPAVTSHPSGAALNAHAGVNPGKLVRCLLSGAEVVAVISTGPADDATGICEGIFAEFSSAGKRVVLVSVDKLLPMDIVTLPDENAFMPGSARNIWLWPRR